MTGKPRSARLLDDNGAPVDLQDAMCVRISLDGAEHDSAIVDRAQGLVTLPEPPAEVGTYTYETEICWSDGTHQLGLLPVEVIEEVED